MVRLSVNEWLHRWGPLQYRWFLLGWVLTLSLGSALSLEAAQIKGVRYSSDTTSTRLVLDISGDFSYRELPLSSGKLQFQLEACEPAPNLAEISLESDLIERVQLTESTGGTLLSITTRQPTVHRAFSIPNPNRLVIDVSSKAAVPPKNGAPEPPDPNQAIPLRSEDDPSHALIETMTRAKEMAESGPARIAKGSVTEAATSGNWSQNPDVASFTGNLSSTQPEENAPDHLKANPFRPNPVLPKATSASRGLANPWVLGQLVFDLFLLAVIGILWRHSKKMADIVKLQQASTDAGQQTAEAQRPQERPSDAPMRTSASEPEENAAESGQVPDFEALVQQSTTEEAEIRGTGAHDQAIQQSKKKRKTVAAPVDEMDADLDESAAMDAQNGLAADELRIAFKRISAQIESMIDDSPEKSRTEVPNATAKQQAENAEEPSRTSRNTSRQTNEEDEVPMRERVLSLATQGMEPMEISQELGIPRGEVDLTLRLRTES